MAHRKDICKCGHLREDHNNRIKGNYYPEMYYNCCMFGTAKENTLCGCTKFNLDKPFRRKEK